jgi:hypothetical protein
VLRAERLVRNQAFFREVNEQILDVSATRLGPAVESEPLLEFLCECGKPVCFERLALTAMEYQAVRADPTTFVVAPGHEITSIEEVKVRHRRFTIVAKFHPESRKAARERDPRLHSRRPSPLQRTGDS